jgi:hypothetical protein
MSKEYETKFSGVKQKYDTGATRDKKIGKGRFDLIPTGPLMRLAQVYERGANNHGARNWELGFPMSRAMDSALRHILQYKDGMRDEDHLAQAVWNLIAIMHFEAQIEKGNLPESLNDLMTYYGYGQ